MLTSQASLSAQWCVRAQNHVDDARGPALLLSRGLPESINSALPIWAQSHALAGGFAGGTAARDADAPSSAPENGWSAPRIRHQHAEYRAGLPSYLAGEAGIRQFLDIRAPTA